MTVSRDVFKEQIVKREPNMADTLKRAGILAVYLIISISVMLLFFELFIFVFFLGGFGVYWVMSKFNLEFEYIFTNGDLDIDVIYGKRSRKRVFTGDVKTDAVQLIVNMNERGYDAQFNNINIKKDCSSGKNRENCYRILAFYKAKKMEIIFEPNETMLAAMQPYLGQRKLIKR